MATYDDVLGYLTTVDFPAGKDEILRAAEQEGAPDDVLRALRALPPVDYGNKNEVARSANVEVAPEQTASEQAQRARDDSHPGIAEHLRRP